MTEDKKKFIVFGVEITDHGVKRGNYDSRYSIDFAGRPPFEYGVSVGVIGLRAISAVLSRIADAAEGKNKSEE